MAIRNPSRSSKPARRGAITLQMLVILGPVILLLMGFAIDLGRLYLIRGELKQASQAMALAAAAQLHGTDASLDNAAQALQAARSNTANIGNKYNFGSITLGESNEGFLTNTVDDPAYFDAAADASGDNTTSSGTASGNTAKYVRITLTADAPLTFFGLLSLGQERKTTIASIAVAGQSAPLCQACGIEIIAVAPVDPEETTNFGFTANTRYSFNYVCNGNPPPQPLAGAAASVRYLLLNRADDTATVFTDPTQQIYRIGLSGMPGNRAASIGCINVNGSEGIWPASDPLQCAFNQTPGPVQQFLCGMASRFDPTTLPGACEAVADIATLSTTNVPDTDLTDLDDYAQYTGNGRRVITVAIVSELLPGGGMTVLGFRQFLLQPLQGSSTFNPADQAGRFVASYLGSPVPLKQGRFDGNCGITSGPGKVVLYR